VGDEEERVVVDVISFVNERESAAAVRNDDPAKTRQGRKPPEIAKANDRHSIDVDAGALDRPSVIATCVRWRPKRLWVVM
jgi:hypothetical protein